MTKKILGACALSLAFAAAPAFAQQHGHAHGGAHQHGAAHQQGAAGKEHDCAMMSAHHAGPHMPLEHRQELGISAEQVARLEAIEAQMKAFHAEHSGHMRGMRDAAPEQRRSMHAAMQQAMRRFGDDTKAVLTADQQAKLEALRQAHHGGGEHGAMHGGQHGQHGGAHAQGGHHGQHGAGHAQGGHGQHAEGEHGCGDHCCCGEGEGCCDAAACMECCKAMGCCDAEREGAGSHG